MKKLVVLAAFIAALAAGSQTLAAVSSLPIGSVEKVLNHELANTSQIVVNVQSADSVQDVENGNVSFLFMNSWRSYTKSDGTTESVKALCLHTSSLSDKTELTALLERMLRTAVRVSVNPNDTSLQGKVIATLAVGEWVSDSGIEVVTFTVENNFILGADSLGNPTVPDNAYKVDLERAIRTSKGFAFFIGNVTGGEVKNAQGNLIDQVFVQPWASNTLVLENEVYSGQPGTVLLRYADGTSQTFSLVDGSLLSPLPKPVLTITPVAPSPALLSKSAAPVTAVKLTVVSAPGTVNLEHANSVGGPWLPLASLTNPTGTVSFTDIASGRARFYRAAMGK